MKWFRMKEVINPAYGRFEDFVGHVSRIFSGEGEAIYKVRDKIEVFEVDGVELNVKRYRVPFLISRVICRSFRQPKAVWAYEHTLRLAAKRFEVPAPIAHILFRKKGFLGYSCFTSLRSSYGTSYKVGQRPAEGNKDVFHALGTYVVKSHEAEVYHADLSSRDVLYDRMEEGVRFSLIDINRMYFEPVSLKQGCASSSRLRGREAAFHLMAETYAESRHSDKAGCLRWVLYYRNHFRKEYASKHEIEFEL